MVRPSDAPSEPSLPGGGFLFNVNLVFITTVIAYALGFLTAVLMARALGDAGLGITALYRNAVTLGFAFLSLGIATALVYFVGRRDYAPRLAMEIGLTITVVATTLTAVGVLIARAMFHEDLVSRDVPYWLVLIAIPAVIQFRVVESVLRAQGRFGAMNLLEVSLPLSLLAFLGVTELVHGLTVENTILVWTLGLLPPLVLGYTLLPLRDWPRRLATGPVLREATNFGVQGQLSNLIQLLNLRLDSYLILLFVNSSGVGLYAVGVSLSEGMWFIANSVGVVLLTNLTMSDDESARRMTPVVCRNTLLVTGIVAVGAAIVAPWFVPAIFGAEYEDSVRPFIWLLPGTVAAAGTKILAAYVFSRGKPLVNAQIGFVTLIVTIVGDLALIPVFEVSGAAAASSAAYIVSLVMTSIAYRRLSGGSINDAILPRRADLSLYREGVRSLWGRLIPARGARGEA